MPDVPLEEYHRKRDADRTPEPMGGEPSSGDGLSFVIQEHHARRLHWDFRLERDGVLVSWAIPKGLPPDPATNHLAVHVEDHPLDYGSFSGSIPSGQYGAGTVSIWDNGYYDTEKWTDREVKVVLHGTRARGRFVLFRTKDPNWMIHRMDGPATPDWKPIPTDLAPMIPTPGPLPDGSSDWTYDMCWDGLRVLVTVEGGRARITTEDGADVTRSYPDVRTLGPALGTTQVLLDGEIVALDEAGRPDTERLRRRIDTTGEAAARRLANKTPVVFIVYDLLHVDGRSLLDVPLSERRQVLEQLPIATGSAQLSPAFDGDGAAALDASRAHGLRGVVAKRISSGYQPGRRSDAWIRTDN